MQAAVDISHYKDTLIVLVTAGVLVPVMYRLKITPILGYLAAGALVGPNGLGGMVEHYPFLDYFTINDFKDISIIAELGVVILLFLIALELSLNRLIMMRRNVFGLGGLQVGLTALIVGFIAPLFGNDVPASVLIGLALALSSTAVVLEWLSQQRRLNTGMGRTSLAVLLFQDLAVIPILFLVGILSSTTASTSITYDFAVALVQAAATLTLIIFLGRLLLRPLFRLVAEAATPELFMAATLLVVIGSGVMTAAAGLSMALGGFIAGLLLAETEYRKSIESVLEPFKGLLLGVFFISVGAKVDVAAIIADPLYIVICALGLVAIKSAVLALLSRAFGLAWSPAVQVGLLLGPCGEFAFIIFGLANAGGIIGNETTGLLLAVVALTMILIPILGWAGQRFFSGHDKSDAEALSVAELASHQPQIPQTQAIIVGAGRVGRLVSQMMKLHGVSHVIIERQPAAAARARDDGFDVFYGDAKNRDLLERCGGRTARAVIITVDALKEVDEIVETARNLGSDIEIIARARDADHARRLYARGVTDAVPETIEASLQLSEASLVALDVPTGRVIASIHEKRDEFRRELQKASQKSQREIRGVRASARRHQADKDSS